MKKPKRTTEDGIPLPLIIKHDDQNDSRYPDRELYEWERLALIDFVNGVPKYECIVRHMPEGLRLKKPDGKLTESQQIPYQHKFNKLLNMRAAMEFMDEYRNELALQIQRSASITKEELIHKATILSEKAAEDKEYTAAVKAIFMIAKILGYMAPNQVYVKKEININFGSSGWTPDEMPVKEIPYDDVKSNDIPDMGGNSPDTDDGDFRRH